MAHQFITTNQATYCEVCKIIKQLYDVSISNPSSETTKKAKEWFPPVCSKIPNQISTIYLKPMQDPKLYHWYNNIPELKDLLI